MKENIDRGLNPDEENKKRMETEADEAEWLELYMANHPEALPPETKREATPEDIAALEAVFTEFEATHPIEELCAIATISPPLEELFTRADDIDSFERTVASVDMYLQNNPDYVATYLAKLEAAKEIRSNLDPQEKRIFEIRMAAKRDLGKVILPKFNELVKETTIADGKKAELKAKLKKLEGALGRIPKGTGKVIH